MSERTGPPSSSTGRPGRLRELLRLGLPLVAGMGGHALFNIVDLVMVGAYQGGPDRPADQTLSAVGIASLVTTAPLVFMNGISNGTVTVIGREYAAGKTRRANQASRQALLLSLFLSVVLGIIPGIFAGDIATAFRAKPGFEHQLTTDYLRLMSVNAWSGFLLMQITANMRATGMAMWTMTLLLLSNVGNIFGNWILVFGHLGAPEMGAMGAAWATVIARGIAALLGVFVLTRANPAIRISLHGGWKPRTKFTWAVTRVGLPVALQWTVRMLAVTLVLLMIAHVDVSDDEVTAYKAAYGVGTRLDTLALFGGLGWGAACAALVSHGVGRGEMNDVRKVTRDSCVLNVITMSLAGVLYFIFAPHLIRFFSLRPDADTSPEMLLAGVRYLRISVFAYPALALGVVWAHALNGTGSVRTPLLLDAVGLLLVQVPLVWILSHTKWGMDGAWWALVISHSLLALAYFLVFRWGAWERRRR